MTLRPSPPGPGFSDSKAAFRQAMRLHAAGVCIITVGAGEDVNGMAATAVTSFCMDTPSLLVCVAETASISPALIKGSTFGVTLLARQHEEVVGVFSRKPSGRRRFSNPGWRLSAGRLPQLADAVANLSCVTELFVSFGIHRALIGRVEHVMIGPETSSLIYRDGSFM